jgi:hypothetical protein
MSRHAGLSGRPAQDARVPPVCPASDVDHRQPHAAQGPSGFCATGPTPQICGIGTRAQGYELKMRSMEAINSAFAWSPCNLCATFVRHMALCGAPATCLTGAKHACSIGLQTLSLCRIFVIPLYCPICVPVLPQTLRLCCTNPAGAQVLSHLCDDGVHHHRGPTARVWAHAARRAPVGARPDEAGWRQGMGHESAQK